MSDLSNNNEREQLERIQQAKTLRMDAFKKIDNQLRQDAKTLDRRSTFMRITIIVLGALVAVKGVIDQLMIDFGANNGLSMLIQISFLFIGIAISVIASFQAAFKYEEKAAQLRELASRAYGMTAEYMVKFDKPSAVEDMWRVLDDQTFQFRKLIDDVAKVGVTLADLGISFDSAGLPLTK